MKLAIIGAGAMGSWFARFAKQSRWDVTITDIDLDRANQVAKAEGIKVARSSQEAVAGANVVVVAVPISATPAVVSGIAKHMPVGSLLMDLSSAKADVFSEMRKLKTNSELASLHPLFGPGAKSVKGRKFISVPIKTGRAYEDFVGQLRELGAIVVEMDADEHDRLMAITQCLTHFVLMAYVKALKSMKHAKRAEELQTPISGGMLELARAFLATCPDMHGEIQVGNRYASIARSAAIEACRTLNSALEAKNTRALRTVFEDARKLVGPAETQVAYKRLYEEANEA